jgi:hypothetical protein
MYKSFSKFILRTPAFPFNKLNEYSADNEYLLKQFNEENFQEALFLASPVLYNEYLKLLDDEKSDKKDKKRIINSITRYFYRMSSRCTPFGLFSSCSLGNISEKTSLLLKNNYVRKSRLDMQFLNDLYYFLNNLGCFKEDTVYFKNTTLYKLQNKYRFLEIKYSDEGEKRNISEVDVSKYLNMILRESENGLRIIDIVNILKQHDILEEQSLDFIDDLINSQIIVSELDRFVCGYDYLEKIIDLLNLKNQSIEIAEILCEIKTQLEIIDANNKPNVGKYSKIISNIKKMGIPYKDNLLFQVDLFNNTKENTLSEDIIKELQLAISFLNKITKTNPNKELLEFKQKFFERYEFQEIPLCEVLDLDIGIGYPTSKHTGDLSPLLDDIQLPVIEKKQISSNSNETYLKLLNSKIIEALSKNLTEIIITDNDVKDLQTNWKDSPSTIFCLIEVIKNCNDELLIYLKHCSGVCAANLLSRFYHINHELNHFIKDIVDKEKELNSDVILAEIVHLPEYRVGNILFKPHMRDYEIVYMGNSDIVPERKIHVSDLMLSIRDNRLYLRSKKMNKEIVPRLTSAHNYQNGLPMYKFLCDMQMQFDRVDFSFNIGKAEYSFYPRIRYNKIILSPMTWVIDVLEIKSFLEIINDKQLIYETKIWRKAKKIPKYTVYIDGDNNLLIDWDAVLSINSFFSIIKERERIIISEYMFDLDNIIVKDVIGNLYTNECIVLFYKDI